MLKTGTRTRAIVVVALFGIVALVGHATPSLADTPTPTPLPVPPTTIPVTMNGDGWIIYGNLLSTSLTLVAPSTNTIAGKVGSDGACTFSESGTIAVGSAGMFEEEIAFNPVTCQERMISGTLTAASLATLNSMTSVTLGSQARSGSAPASATVKTSALAAAAQYKQDYTKSAYIDPVNITIASFTTNLKWPLNGASGTLTGRFNPYNFAWGVWTNTGNPPFNFYRTASPNGYALQGAESFTNWEFAALIAFLFGSAGTLACQGSGLAHFNFDETTYGRDNGAAAYSTNHSTSGACTNLTHYAHWADFGWSS